MKLRSRIKCSSFPLMLQMVTSVVMIGYLAAVVAPHGLGKRIRYINTIM